VPCGQTLQLADTVMAVRLQEVPSSQSLLTVPDDFEGGIQNHVCLRPAKSQTEAMVLDMSRNKYQNAGG